MSQFYPYHSNTEPLTQQRQANQIIQVNRDSMTDGDTPKFHPGRASTVGLQTPEYTSVMDEQQGIDESEMDANKTNNDAETYADADGSMSGADNSTNLGQNDAAIGSDLVTLNDNNDSMGPSQGSTSHDVGFEIKPDGKSAKYPELKRYYEFGNWVGRNRKAICIRCRHTAASSQPLRLIKHLRKCVKLSDQEKAEVEDLLTYGDNNTKWKSNKSNNLGASLSEDSDIWGTESPNQRPSGGSSFLLPTPGLKRVKREHPEWKASVDQALVRWIVHNRVPLKTIHSKEFVEFVRALDPEYHLPSRETITNVLIPRALNIL